MARSEIVFTVSKLNEYANSVLTNDVRLRSIKVKGEIVGFKRHSAGHLYFSLKDENALIRCVMFRSHALSLAFEPEDGMLVTLSGNVSIYVKDGQYQFYATGMKQAGEGNIYKQFLELKDKLYREGLFSRKRPIPMMPKCIGVITSETGAVLHDILTVTKRRFPKMRVLFSPASVQGSNAPEELINAIEVLNATGIPDVIIIGRGGGSYEELSCFNDEGLARAIFASSIPTVSAVGHETDYTIADFVSDVRAATPSAAAELCVPELEHVINSIDRASDIMHNSVVLAMKNARSRVLRSKDSPALSNPAILLEMKRQFVRSTSASMENTMVNALTGAYARLDSLNKNLDAMNPYAVLKRGYAMVSDENGGFIANAASAECGQRLNIILTDGIIGAVADSVKIG